MHEHFQEELLLYSSTLSPFQTLYLGEQAQSFRLPSYLLVLSIPKFSKRVSSFPSIPCEYIQIAIHTKEQLPTVVICSWFLKLQEIP